MTRRNSNVTTMERPKYRQTNTRHGSAKTRRGSLGLRWIRRVMPLRWFLSLVVVAAIMFVILLAPNAFNAGFGTFVTTAFEDWFGEEPVTVEQVEQVLYGNLERGQAVGIAMREIELHNQTVEIEDTDLAGWGSERLTGEGTVIALAEVTLENLRVEEVETGLQISLQAATLKGLYFPASREDGFPVLTERSRNLVTRVGDLFGSVTPELSLYEAMVRSAQPLAEQDRSLLAAAEAAAAANVRQLLGRSGVNVEVIFVDG